MALFARWRRGRVAIDAALFAVLWLLAELARTVIFTGFPWLASGYAQIDGPLAAWAPWVGVSGIGALCALLAALLAAAWHSRAPPGRALAALARGAGDAGAVGRWSARASSARPSGELSVSLLQGNVPQDQKFVAAACAAGAGLGGAGAGRARAASWWWRRRRPCRLLPEQLAELVPDYWPALRARFEGSGQAALIGVPLGDYTSGYTNSVLGLSAASRGASPTATTRCTWCPSASSSRRAFAGSPS